MVTWPDVGLMRPTSIRIVVVFPAPFGPRKPKTSPRCSSKETLSTIVLSPMIFVRLVAVRVGLVSFIGAPLPGLVPAACRRDRRRDPLRRRILLIPARRHRLLRFDRVAVAGRCLRTSPTDRAHHPRRLTRARHRRRDRTRHRRTARRRAAETERAVKEHRQRRRQRRADARPAPAAR